MRQPATASRLKALLLATVFVGGGIGLPAIDFLVYHLGSYSQDPQQAHFDPVGGCNSHAENCTLGGGNPAPRLSTSLVSSLVARDVGFVPPPPEPVSAPRTSNSGKLPLSRAPPRLV